jgi:hypothetical protein
MRTLALLFIGLLLLGALIGAPVLVVEFAVAAVFAIAVVRIRRTVVVAPVRIAFASSPHRPRASLLSAN